MNIILMYTYMHIYILYMCTYRGLGQEVAAAPRLSQNFWSTRAMGAPWLGSGMRYQRETIKKKTAKVFHTYIGSCKWA